MDGPVIVGIDVGTTKICTLVAREEAQAQLRILGTGVEPAQGIKKGVVVDLGAAFDLAETRRLLDRPDAAEEAASL